MKGQLPSPREHLHASWWYFGRGRRERKRKEEKGFAALKIGGGAVAPWGGEGGKGGQLGEKWEVGSNFWRNDWFVIGEGFWESE